MKKSRKNNSTNRNKYRQLHPIALNYKKTYFKNNKEKSSTKKKLKSKTESQNIREMVSYNDYLMNILGDGGRQEEVVVIDANYD